MEEKRVPSTRGRSPGWGSSNGVSPGLKQEADGDGQTLKGQESPPATAPSPDGGSNKKFACPYFKRNPKNFPLKWTSCPARDGMRCIRSSMVTAPSSPSVHADSFLPAGLTSIDDTPPHPMPALLGSLQGRQPLSLFWQDPPCAIQGNRTLQEGFIEDQENPKTQNP